MTFHGHILGLEAKIKIGEKVRISELCGDSSSFRETSSFLDSNPPDASTYPTGN